MIATEPREFLNGRRPHRNGPMADGCQSPRPFGPIDAKDLLPDIRVVFVVGRPELSWGRKRDSQGI